MVLFIQSATLKARARYSLWLQHEWILIGCQFIPSWLSAKQK